MDGASGRSRTPEGLKVSPFEARRGRKMVLPSMFLLPHDDNWTASQKEMREAYEKILRLRDEAAEKMKKAFDKGIKEKEFKVGQRVWLRNEEVTAQNPKERIGPFEIVRLTGPVNVEIKEVPNGPKLGTRHKIQSIRNMVEYVGPDPEPEPEFVVTDVVDHRGHGRGRKYRVRWGDGSFTWEPKSNLVDVKEDGTEVVNEAFGRYLERIQSLAKTRSAVMG